MSYTPPEISTPVVLLEGYVPPSLAVPLSSLCEGAEPPPESQTVQLTVALPADSLELSLHGSVSSVVSAALTVSLTPDVLGLVPVISGHPVQAPTLAVQLPPEDIGLALEAQAQNGYGATLHTAVAPDDLPLSALLIEQITTAKIAANLPPDVLPLVPALGVQPISGAWLAVNLALDEAPLVGALAGVPVHAPVLAIGLPPDDLALTLSAATRDDLALPDDRPNPYPASVRSRQQRSSASDGCRMRQTEAARSSRCAGLHQATAEALVSGITTQQTAMQPLSRFARLLETDGIRITARTDTTQAETLRQRRPIRLSETDTQRLTASTRTPHAERIYTRTRREWREQEAAQVDNRLGVGHHAAALDTWTHLSTPATEAMWPLPGRWAPCYEVPSMLHFEFDCRNPIPPELPVVIELQRCCTRNIRLPWVPPIPGGQIIIPIRRIYRVLNTVTLTRVRDGQPIDVSRLSLSLSADAWTWSWSATMPAAMLDLIRVSGEPQELLATVNGESIRLRIDQISRSRSFGSASLSVSGRGRAAVLASPTAPTLNLSNSEQRTAQQLVLDALMDNGVPIGWDVDWQIEDWTIPAGAWSLTGAYIEAAKRLAEAGGGYVQGHDTDPTLIVRPYYPVAPWNWSETTPDIVMPEDVCHTEGIEWREKPAYNSVWVTGNVGGRRDWIRRAGTDGTTMAQTIVDDLATSEIMTRQRGIRVLGDTGKQAWVTVSLPVIEETGLIRPGNLIEYSEQGHTHLGLSRSLSVECQFPQVWQTIQVETHPS